MILALIFSCAAAIFGIATAYALKISSGHMFRLCAGVLFGLAVTTTLTYTLAIWLPLSPLLLWTETGGLIISAGLLLWRSRKTIKYHSFDQTAAIVFACLLMLSVIISPKLLIPKDGGYSTGIINAYGDVAWHAANITMFAEGQSVPPENPIFGGNRLTYPFMTNFASALLLVGDASLPTSITTPAIILIPILLTLLYCFARDYTNSKKIGVLAMLLFLFGGATLGFFRISDDFKQADTSLFTFITHLPDKDYSGVGTDPNGFHFLNPVTTLLLPQRSFLFGIPIALVIITLLRSYPHKRKHEYIAAGVFSGLLPLFHGHSVLALIPVIVGLFLLKPRIKPWLLFLIPALAIGLPGVLYYAFGHSEPGAFFRFDPGWMADGHNVITYWIQNTGLLLPVVVAALAMRSPKQIKILAGAGLLLFAAANTWLFAPWAWDNFKLFVYFFIFCLPAVGWVVLHTWRTFSFLPTRVILVILVVLHMASAGLDIFKLALPTATVWVEWDEKAVTAAKMIQEKTKPGDIILTAPTHNSAVVLAGRPHYLGYAAHVWSHGGDPWQREKAIKNYLQGNNELLPDVRPQFVLVGPQEEYSFKPIVTRPNWTLAGQSGSYYLYKLN